MGKSKGNVISLADIQTKYSADLFRFYISHSADLGINMDWREKEIQTVKNHINRFYNFMFENIQEIQGLDLEYNEIDSDFAKVIISKAIQNFVEAAKVLKKFNIRRYLQLSFYETFNLIQDSKKYFGKRKDFKIIFKLIFEDWLKVLSLTMPHLCEELWELSNHQGFISATIWGNFKSNYINKELEHEYDYISTLINDILNVKKVIKTQTFREIYIYTAPDWKIEALKIIVSKKGDINSIISEIKKDSILTKNKQVMPFIKSQIKKRIWESQITLRNESETLQRYKTYIENRVDSQITIDADFDPESKASKALPYKPAIYIKTS